MAKVKKEKVVLLDSWGNPKEIEQVRKAIRMVWSRSSNSRKIAKKRCLNEDGFFQCEECWSVVPSIQIHHRITVGDLDSGFLSRLFCPSEYLLCLCPKCHRKHTNAERGNK